MNNIIKKTIDYKEECRAYMAEVGLPLDGPLITDGNVKRYSADVNQYKRDEWYIGYEGVSSRGNVYLTCIFGSWSDGLQYQYKSFDNVLGFDEQEIIELKNTAQQQRVEAERIIKKEQDQKAIEAQQFWEGCSIKLPSPEYARYIEKKNIQLFSEVRFGLYQDKYPSLVIPLYDTQDELRSLQFIWVNDAGKTEKRFFKGAQKKGNNHLIGEVTDDKDAIFVGEGYATCTSIYQAIKKPVAVAFDAGNIDSVVGSLKHKFPQVTIIIAADNDPVGLSKAHDVANKYKDVFVVIPIFPAGLRKNGDTDFNDLHKLVGIEEVEKQLLKGYVASNAGYKLAKKYFTGEPCKKFHLKNLPNALGSYIYSIHKTTNAHPIMLTVSTLTMVSSYLGTKVLIPEGAYFQNLYANLWILCIASSGQFKTTALNKGAKIAFENQSHVFSEIKEMRDMMQSDNPDIEKDMLRKSLENVVLPTKVTAEAWLEHLAQGHQGAIYPSEFGGWLQNLDKNYNNDFKAIMTELFDVPTTYRYKTKTQGDCVLIRPYVSICGVSTIPWVRSNMKPSDVPSGFFARFLIFTPPFDEQIPPALPSPTIEMGKEIETAFRQRLDRILISIGEQRIFTLTEEAQKYFYKYHVLIYCVPRACTETVGELLQPYIKRWSPALLKIAMIMQLFIDPESCKITGEAIIKAFHILNPAIKSTIALFEGELGESNHQRKCRTLLKWMSNRAKKDKTSIKRQAILASKQLHGGAQEYDIVLKDLIEQGKIIYKELLKKNESEYTVVEDVETN